MVSKPLRIVTALTSLALLSTACAKEKKKFGLSSPHKEAQLIVTLKDKAQGSSAAALLQSFSHQTEALNNRSYLLKFDADIDLATMAEQIAARSDVLAVEANQIYKLYEKVPNDSSFLELWGLKNSGQNLGKPGVDIGAASAWDETTGSRDVLVAVIDSGVDYNHPDLKDNIWTNPLESGLDQQGRDKSSNGVDDDGNGLIDDWRGYDFFSSDNDPMDDNSHGTHVAGTVGASGDNQQGVVGVNWNVSIVPIKVFSASGATSTDVLVKGIEYATSLGVFVSNNSWGGGEFSEAIYGAIRKADEKSILFVAAAGNESEDNDFGLHFPSNYDSPNIISVAAIDRKERVSVFSNFGANTVDVAAPGEDIYSTLPKGKYGIKSGTSMATPHVTGALALLKSRFPELNATEIRTKLLSSTVPSPTLVGKSIYGRIQVANAMESDQTPPSAVGGLDITSVGVNAFSLAWSPSGDDGEIGLASSYSMRLSAEAITTEEQWLAAESPVTTQVTREGDGIIATVSGLSYNRKGFVSVRALDNVGNLSALSDSLPFALKVTKTLWDENNDPVHQWAGFGSPWTVRTVGDISMVSDSPLGLYANSLDKSVVSRDITLGTSELVLELRHKFELEKDFDFGLIEVSLNSGLNWKEVGRVNGSSDWTNQSYALNTALGEAKSFRLRLRLKSDSSVNYEGWDIDSLKLIGAKPQ